MPNGVPNGQLAVQLFKGAKAPPTTFLMPYGNPVQLFFNRSNPNPVFLRAVQNTDQNIPSFSTLGVDGGLSERRGAEPQDGLTDGIGARVPCGPCVPLHVAAHAAPAGRRVA